jgi:uncharacterized DUF497 family protein
MVRIKQLVWDDWNVEHIRKHRVNINEVEEVCKAVKKTLKTYRERLIVLGKTTQGRLLTVVLAPESKGRYYVVSARDMSRKERRILK